MQTSPAFHNVLAYYDVCSAIYLLLLIASYFTLPFFHISLKLSLANCGISCSFPQSFNPLYTSERGKEFTHEARARAKLNKDGCSISTFIPPDMRRLDELATPKPSSFLSPTINLVCQIYFRRTHILARITQRTGRYIIIIV